MRERHGPGDGVERRVTTGRGVVLRGDVAPELVHRHGHRAAAVPDGRQLLHERVHGTRGAEELAADGHGQERQGAGCCFRRGGRGGQEE